MRLVRTQRTQRDGEPWLDEVGDSFTKLATERAVKRIGKDIVKNGELAGGIATATAWVPVIGQVVAIAATIVSVAQMLTTAKKLSYMNEYLRVQQTLMAGYASDLNEEYLAGRLELERLNEELYYMRNVKKAYTKTIFISSGLVLTAVAIMVMTTKKK